MKTNDSAKASRKPLAAARRLLRATLRRRCVGRRQVQVGDDLLERRWTSLSPKPGADVGRDRDLSLAADAVDADGPVARFQRHDAPTAAPSRNVDDGTVISAKPRSSLRNLRSARTRTS